MKTSLRVLTLLIPIISAWPIAFLLAQSVNFPKPEVIAAQQGLPQGFIPGIAQDARGLIWIATRNGLCRYDGRHIKIFHPANSAAPALSSLGLESLNLAPDKKIWVLSDQGDIDLFDPVSETIFNYSQQAFFKKAFGKRYLKRIFPDKQNRLWLIFDKPGMAVIDIQTSRVRWYRHQENGPDSLNTLNVRQIAHFKNGDIWIASRNGIFRVYKKSGNLLRYHSNHPDFGQIEKSAYALQERHNGDILLIGKNGVAILKPGSGEMVHYPLPPDRKAEYDHPIVSDSKGNHYFFRMNALFRFSDQDGLQEYPQLDNFSEFKSLFIDHSDVLWAGTNGQGVRKYNLRAAYFKAMSYRKSFIYDLLSHVLQVPERDMEKAAPNLFEYNFRYAYDKQQNLWFSGGRTPLYKLDLRTKNLEVVPFPVTVTNISRADMAISLSADRDGRIWAAHDSIVGYYENNHWTPFQYPIRPGIESAVMQLVVDDRALWFATSQKGLYRIDRATGKIRRFAHVDGNANTISNDNIYCLFADPENPDLLWIGTFGGGFCRFDKRTGSVKRITTQEGLPNDVAYTAIPDGIGNVWVATNQGLARVNKKTFKIRIYTREDGLVADEFNRFHSFRLPNGEIFLGGIEGITSFDPRKSYDDRFQPTTVITAMAINNEPIENIGKTPVSTVKELQLDYRKNFVTIEFAAMQFNRSDKIRYRYQLQGLEDHWIETEEPVTKYTDLRPGHYVLRLNASNTEGIWSKYISTLQIVIAPPWWETWWAYLLYTAAAFAMGYWLLKMYTNRLKLRQSFILKQKELELIDKESKQLRELDEMKTRFFSNITHEFRTPLTLILTPAEQMLGEPRKAEDIGRLGLIDRNAHQLLSLVNQLLDLSKLESGTMKVTEVQSDLNDYVGQLVASFQGSADAKHIALKYEEQDLANAYWFDHEKLERILNNLLSNALKFTPEGGQVSVNLTGHPNGVTIIVSDTGIGIPPEKLEHIFERFYQVDSETGYREGTGIGLAIVKELVEIQNGTVQVESPAPGSGTKFTIHLPLRAAASPDLSPISGSVTTYQSTANQAVENPDTDIKILLVEDHLELGDFIADSLSKNYQCYRAGNGEEALVLMHDLMPDLVVSDVMMPVMDGYAFCRHIKSDLQFSHIPVILLTAKSAVESKMEGLSEGADDYMTKPFHMPELELRIRNMVARQRRFRDMLHAQFTTREKAPEIQPEEVTDPFLIKLYAILDAQLENTEFGVNELITEIGMSNSSLNRKLKVLTDLSPVELIRNYRLKKAAQYLSGGMGVSEAAYLVGFDNLSYFAKCFRDLFHMSPRDFAAKV